MCMCSLVRLYMCGVQPSCILFAINCKLVIIVLTFGRGSNKGPIQRITIKTNDAEKIL